MHSAIGRALNAAADGRVPSCRVAEDNLGSNASSLLPGRVLRFVKRIAARPGPAELRQMRRRLADDSGRVETVLRATIEMVGGVYVPPERIHGPEDEEGPLFESVLGLENARTEAPIGQQPWLRGSITDVLVESTRTFGGDWSRDLTDMTDRELEVGRERWRVLRDYIEIIEEMSEMYGTTVRGSRTKNR